MNHARRFQARNLSRNECAQFGALEFLAERRHDFEGLAGYFYISSTLQLFKKGNINMGASQMHGIALLVSNLPLFRMAMETIANKDKFLKKCRVHVALKHQISQRSKEASTN